MLVSLTTPNQFLYSASVCNCTQQLGWVLCVWCRNVQYGITSAPLSMSCNPVAPKRFNSAAQLGFFPQMPPARLDGVGLFPIMHLCTRSRLFLSQATGKRSRWCVQVRGKGHTHAWVPRLFETACLVARYSSMARWLGTPSVNLSAART